MFNSLSEFYTSRQWERFLQVIKDERTNEEGFIICEHCGKPIVQKYDCIGHHKQELTEANVNNYDISLNPDNVALVHHKCHNIIHERFGCYIRKVYIVHGAPCSGKTSFVESVANKDDIVLDMDSIWQMISITPEAVNIFPPFTLMISFVTWVLLPVLHRTEGNPLRLSPEAVPPVSLSR